MQDVELVAELGPHDAPGKREPRLFIGRELRLPQEALGVCRRSRPGELAQVGAAAGKAEHVDVVVQRPRARPGRKADVSREHDAAHHSPRDRHLGQPVGRIHGQPLLGHVHA